MVAWHTSALLTNERPRNLVSNVQQNGPQGIYPREDVVSKRELIEPHPGHKRYARRDPDGQFTKDQVDVGKSLAADRRTKSKTVAPKGQGDRGDQKTRKG
jgi:hypothetical protein